MNVVRVILADWVFAGEGAALRDGGVAVADGRIVRVGPADELLRMYAGADVERMPGCALAPGMVNAHTHLELGFLRGMLPAGPFVPWVIGLMKAVASEPDLAATVALSVREGVAESLRGGVTLLGDITKQVTASRGALRTEPIHAVSFGEVQALGKRRSLLGERLAAAADAALATERMRIGLSPHAPYTVEGPALRAVLDRARADGLPVCMHLAELQEESAFLAGLEGPIRQAWEQVGIASELLDEAIPCHAGGPIRWAQAWGLLEGGTPVLLAHVNYADAEELAILQAAGASVAYCPRTRGFFGHDAASDHPFLTMHDRGINVCLGTDSLASNPDLHLLREAQYLLRRFPALDPLVLLDLLTINGARALGAHGHTGSLAEGKRADMVALETAPAGADDSRGVLTRVFAEAALPRAVWLGGNRII